MVKADIRKSAEEKGLLLQFGGMKSMSLSYKI